MRGIIVVSALIGLISILCRVYLIERPSLEILFPIKTAKYQKEVNILLFVFYIAFFTVIILTAIDGK